MGDVTSLLELALNSIFLSGQSIAPLPKTLQKACLAYRAEHIEVIYYNRDFGDKVRDGKVFGRGAWESEWGEGHSSCWSICNNFRHKVILHDDHFFRLHTAGICICSISESVEQVVEMLRKLKVRHLYELLELPTDSVESEHWRLC